MLIPQVGYYFVYALASFWSGPFEKQSINRQNVRGVRPRAENWSTYF